jgi:hypothetical protein
MVDVKTQIDINAPIHKVAGYAIDPSNAPKWYVNIKSSRQLPDGISAPIHKGSLIAFTAHFLGKKLEYTYEVAELTDTQLVMRTADGPFPMETTYTFEKISDNVTRMHLRNRGAPSGFSRLFAPLMSTMMRRANEKDLRSIKNILERKE